MFFFFKMKRNNFLVRRVWKFFSKLIFIYANFEYIPTHKLECNNVWVLVFRRYTVCFIRIGWDIDILRCLFWCVPICTWIQIQARVSRLIPTRLGINGQMLIYKCYWTRFTPESSASYCPKSEFERTNSTFYYSMIEYIYLPTISFIFYRLLSNFWRSNITYIYICMQHFYDRKKIDLRFFPTNETHH